MWGRVCPRSLCHWVNEAHGHVASNQDLSCTMAGVCLHTCMCCQCSVILGRMFPRCTIVWFIFKKKKKTGTIITNGRCSPSPFCWHHLNPPTNSGDAHCHHPLCFDSTTSPPQSPHECQWWCLPPPSSPHQPAPAPPHHMNGSDTYHHHHPLNFNWHQPPPPPCLDCHINSSDAHCQPY